MNFDKAVDQVLRENYFGGTPYERVTGIKRQVTFEPDPIEEDALDDAIKDWQRSDKKKKSALQKAADARHELSPRGQDYIDKLSANKVKYQIGGKIRSPNPEYTKIACDLDEAATIEHFSDANLEYHSWDQGKHYYKYPSGGTTLKLDDDGFRIEAHVKGSPDEPPFGDNPPVFPTDSINDLDKWTTLNVFCKGADEPIFSAGKGVRASQEGIKDEPEVEEPSPKTELVSDEKKAYTHKYMENERI